MKSRYSNGNIFTDVKVAKFPRHKFNKSFFNKLTLNHGLLVPFFTKDVVPGDKIDLKVFGRVQLQPLATSSMQNIKVYFRYFYVPYRLLWPEWDDFMIQDPQSQTRLFAPYTTIRSSSLSPNSPWVQPGFLPDYLNLGLWNGRDFLFKTSARISFNLFRFAAYKLIWDSYFRDENLQDPVFTELLSGYSDPSLRDTALLPVAYAKDYFTSALPWPQKGEPVNLNAYVSSAVINTDVNHHISYLPNEDVNVRLFGIGIQEPGGLGWPVTDNYALSPDGVTWGVPEDKPLVNTARREIYSSVSVPIESNTLSTSININDLRYSNALQRFLERKALGGSRPAEFYLSMYGVHVDDLRIGMPKYLGGGYSNVSITDVEATANSSIDDVTQPTGTLTGNGKSFPAIKINKPYYCQEFGVVMGVMYIRPEMNYSQGIPKEMQLFDTLDFYNPVFAHLGEEAVSLSELVAKSDLVNHPTDSGYNDDIFGYQSRYSYLKHSRNEVHGDFKTTLSNWLIAPVIPDNVVLNSEFITIDQDYSIFAVEDEGSHHYLVELFNQFECESSMPDFAIPSL